MLGVEPGVEPVLAARIEEERGAEELAVHMERLEPYEAARAGPFVSFIDRVRDHLG